LNKVKGGPGVRLHQKGAGDGVRVCAVNQKLIETATNDKRCENTQYTTSKKERTRQGKRERERERERERHNGNSINTYLHISCGIGQCKKL